MDWQKEIERAVNGLEPLTEEAAVNVPLSFIRALKVGLVAAQQASAAAELTNAERLTALEQAQADGAEVQATLDALQTEHAETLVSMDSLATALTKERNDNGALRSVLDKARVDSAATQATLEALQTAHSNKLAELATEKAEHGVTKETLTASQAATAQASALADSLSPWQGRYTTLLNELQPGVGFPADYDFAAEHENDIARARAHSQVDVTLERDDYKARLEVADRKVELRNKAKLGSLTDEEIDELQGK